MVLSLCSFVIQSTTTTLLKGGKRDCVNVLWSWECGPAPFWCPAPQWAQCRKTHSWHSELLPRAGCWAQCCTKGVSSLFCPQHEYFLWLKIPKAFAGWFWELCLCFCPCFCPCPALQEGRQGWWNDWAALLLPMGNNGLHFCCFPRTAQDTEQAVIMFHKSPVIWVSIIACLAARQIELCRCYLAKARQGVSGQFQRKLKGSHISVVPCFMLWQCCLLCSSCLLLWQWQESCLTACIHQVMSPGYTCVSHLTVNA